MVQILGTGCPWHQLRYHLPPRLLGCLFFGQRKPLKRRRFHSRSAFRKSRLGYYFSSIYSNLIAEYVCVPPFFSTIFHPPSTLSFPPFLSRLVLSTRRAGVKSIRLPRQSHTFSDRASNAGRISLPREREERKGGYPKPRACPRRSLPLLSVPHAN